MPLQRHGAVHYATEWEFVSTKQHDDLFAEVELDVVFTDSIGTAMRVPAYWAGEGEWRVRFAPLQAGLYTFRTICSDTTDAGLHDRSGTLEVPTAYDGNNSLLQHGPLRVSSNGHTFEHADGTPFFWLGDTWWMSLCQRMSWPDDFQLLTADRVAKGFTVVQLVAGLYPDMPAFDPRGTNEAGYPWTEGFGTLNPAYFDMADLRIRWLVRSGIVPCIVGFWGYYLSLMGLTKIKQHWRNLIARYGAYPVVWCLAGEGIMPYYLSPNREADSALQKKGLTDLARYVRSIDPYHHPITIHPTNATRTQVEDPAVVDFEMLQTGHDGYASLPNTVNAIRQAVARKPQMPALVDEVDYEGIMESSREEVQRICFWTSMLSGAAGHTYGANGLWQVNTREQPYGPSPHGASWGNVPWQDAYRLPGSAQLGIAKRLFERYEWHRFQSHPDWVDPSADGKNVLAPYCAGIPGQVRIYYFPTPIAPWTQLQLAAKLEQTVTYTAFFFDPKTGNQQHIGRVMPLADGTWRVPLPPIIQDWVLVLERAA
jgi:hypothetical protein